MALSDIDMIRLIVGDTASSPFYPLLSDEELQAFLDFNNGNVRRAAVSAAISISMILPSIPIRERTGQIEVWSNVASAYLASLANLINPPMELSLSGITPWAGGISWKQFCRNINNADVILHPLDEISDSCEPECGCYETNNCTNCKN